MDAHKSATFKTYYTIHKNFEHFHGSSRQAMQAIAMVTLYENKPLQNALKRI